MSFDADGDGKLDRSELEKWAGEMIRMRGDPEAGRRGPPRPRADREQEGDRGRDRPRDGDRPGGPPADAKDAPGVPG